MVLPVFLWHAGLQWHASCILTRVALRMQGSIFGTLYVRASALGPSMDILVSSHTSLTAQTPALLKSDSTMLLACICSFIGTMNL